MNKKVMLIDGNNIIFRSFYAIPHLTNSKGEYTNGVYGFLTTLFKLVDDEKPDYLGVAFDLSEPTKRHILYPEYKGNRKSVPEELIPQFALIREVLKSMNIHYFELAGYEADDILASLANESENKNFETVIVSGDKDLLQVASETIKIKMPITRAGKSNEEEFYAQDVFEKYLVSPKEFIDLKAFMGDSSDNIPGVPGVGEKTAMKLIAKYKSMDNVYDNIDEIAAKKLSENLREYKEQAYLSKELVTIDKNVPVSLDLDKMRVEFFNNESLDIFKRLEFKSLIDKYFDKDDSLTDIKIKYKKIDDSDLLNKFLSKIKDDFFYNLFYSEKAEIFYLAISSDENIFISFTKDDDKIINELRYIFENQKINKISYMIKDDMHILSKIAIEISKPYYDLSLAAYILDALKQDYTYNSILSEYLNIYLASEEDLLGKGVKKKDFSEIDILEIEQLSVQITKLSNELKVILDNKIKENKQEDLIKDIELPLIEVLYSIEKEGIGIDENKLIDYQEALHKNIEKLEEDIFLEAGEEFNLNSPKQLGIVLFEKMNLPGAKKNKTAYSTASPVLEKLALDYPFVNKILLYRQLAKLKSTYADGLLKVMDKKSKRIHSTFNQTITATGRLSSTEPNLQNIPIRFDLGREFRKVFVAKEGYLFLDGDYSQIELRVLAHMSDDKTLIEAFKNNDDIHSITASEVFGVDISKVNESMRSDAKAVNFGIVYGIGAFSLSKDLKISVKQAERYIEGYFRTYPKVKEFLDNTITAAKENSYVETLFNRRRNMPEFKSKNFNIRSFGERVAMNMPIQGTAADIIKIAMNKLHKRLSDENLKSKIILQVHDELLIETKNEELEIVKTIMLEEMENAADLKVELLVDIQKGKDWFNLE